MLLLTYFAEERGRLAKMARRRKLNPGYLSQVAKGTKELKPRYVPAIERDSGYMVRRWDLRPDDWYEIWPELIGTEGAPPVEQSEAAHE